ncbi:kinase-like protein [Ceratobasidium sp. AG-I]|nr:kinase-like protein [Ceratobasidium sp. AG-I]
MDEKLQKVLEDNSKIIKNQGTTTTITHRSTPSFDTVTGNMSAQDMFLCLVQRGCADLSLSVDPDRYSESAIASGGFGDVWQAWMKDGTKNGILVAVKCLRLHMILEGDKKGMKRAMLIFQGKLGMVSVWRPNGNLQQYIKSNPGVERHPLCVQLTKGVAYLHEIGMVHGDLKASTLRFSETSKAGGGTVRWMAPELILLEEGEDAPPPTRNAKTDVYALGMTMLETISGKVPYHQYQHDRTIILALERKQFPKCPEELSGSDERATRMWALLLQCWDHNPKARPDAPSVLASLQSIAP